MFLASERSHHRESKIRSLTTRDPSIGLVLAAVNFEWTVSRAVLFISVTPNKALREKMAQYYSPDSYKRLWREEVCRNISGSPPLPRLIRHWPKVLDGFHARNVLVHGKDRYTAKMANPHINALLDAARDIDSYCESIGKPLYGRMPVRKKAAV